MASSSAIRILVVYKRTTYERMKSQDSARADQFLREADDFAAFVAEEHREHLRTLDSVKQAIEGIRGVASFQTREEVRSVGDADLLVTIGGDGTLLWASHLVGAQTPILAVNSSPTTSVGYFCGASAQTIGEELRKVQAGQSKRTTFQRMRVRVNNDTVSTRVLNDLLISHIHPSLSFRYRIEVDEKREDQISSGIWLGPAAGSTAAIASAGGTVLPPESLDIQYVVREPYSTTGMDYQLLRGIVGKGKAILVRCKIDRAVLYIDGTQQVISVGFGDKIAADLSDDPLNLIGSFGHRFDATKNR